MFPGLEINQDEDVIEEAQHRAHGLLELPNGLPPTARFIECQHLYRKPSAFIKALVANLPSEERLTRDQTLFVTNFAKACDDAWEDSEKPATERRVHHILLLGQGGSGKSHVVQKVIFTASEFIWPCENQNTPTLVVVAASNAQAKNISTQGVKARTLHNASCMGVQKYLNGRMGPKNKAAKLEQFWGEVRVLVIEEISMVAAALYNMLNYRSMLGRSQKHEVYATHAERQCDYKHVPFGRCPIVIHLGDFLQLSPTASLSLITDLNKKHDDGSYVYGDHTVSCWLEVQHACRVFRSIPSVFNLQGTKRFKPGDPLIDFLNCMRTGTRFPEKVWQAFEATFAADNHGVLDPRHRADRWRDGYGMAIYWEPVVRWGARRAQRDAQLLRVPLVFLLSWDECGALDGDAKARLLTVANIHNTGHMHGFLLAHVGMRVRMAAKFNASLGLVQEQKATIVDFVFHDMDAKAYSDTAPGAMFTPKCMPAAIVLKVDKFTASPIAEHDFLTSLDSNVAKSIFLLEPTEQTFTWRSGQDFTVRRVGFQLTHDRYLTSTASQGQTLRSGVTIDCARNDDGARTMEDADWWLHLYVMFSRVTQMSDMLLLRPPSRDFLERGPPRHLQAALRSFEDKAVSSKLEAERMAEMFDIHLPQT